MKKILVVAGQKSYPANDGGKISILYSMLEFTKHFEVYHCFITDKPLTKVEQDFFLENKIRIFPIVKNTKDSSIDLVKNIFHAVPFKMKKYLSNEMFELLFQITRENKIDFAWIVQAHLGSYGLALKRKFNIPVYLREQNIEYELVRQFGIYARNPVFRMIGKWQYLKTRSHERKLWNKLDKSFFISDLDSRQAKNYFKSPEKAVVLHDSFGRNEPVRYLPKEEKSLLFSGSLKTFQNLVNLENFLEEVMSKLVQKDSNWKLYVTANREMNIRQDLKSNNVINAGYVDSIDQYTVEKKYFISPTIMGSGVRIKILNAMALGMVCFISELDNDSMNYYKDMENVVKYSGFAEFYEKLLLLENDQTIYNTISTNALKVHQDLTWEKYAQTVIAAIA